MSDALEVSFDAAGFLRGASRKIATQIPFAFSLALNETIEDIQGELIDDLPSTFTIRNYRTAKGIRVKRSTKRKLVAVVGSKDHFMAAQTDGGDRDGASSAVPVKARTRPKTRLTKSRWPAAFMAKGAFIADFGRGRALWMPSRHKDPKSRRVKLMYHFARGTIRIPKRWPLEATLDRVTGREWAGNVKRALARALRTARR